MSGTAETPQRFHVLFTGANKAMVIFGLHRSNSYADVGESEVTVRMGWAFRATIPRSSIRSVADDHDRVLGWGVHGWRGEWLVNGSSSGILAIAIDPPARARTVGFPIKLTKLRIAVEDRAGLSAALGHHP